MSITKDVILRYATEALMDALKERKTAAPSDLGLETQLFGQKALLDSLGIVTLVMELEQRLEEEHEISIVLADEKAMSRRSSPL